MKELIAEYLDGTLTDQHVGELRRWIAADPANADEFVRECHLHGLLRHFESERSVQKRSREWAIALRDRQARRHLMRPAIRYAAAALIVLGFAGLIATVLTLATRNVPSPHGPSVAAIIDATDAEWEYSGLPTSIGSQLPNGWLKLKSGTAQLEFVGGAQVTLIGPVEFGLNSGMRGFLRLGKLTVYVPRKARGFTIAAPGVSVVDLGTEFGIDVKNNGVSEVRVLRGAVELNLDKSGSGPVRMEAGVASRIVAGEIVARFNVPVAESDPTQLGSRPGHMYNFEGLPSGDLAENTASGHDGWKLLGTGSPQIVQGLDGNASTSVAAAPKGGVGAAWRPNNAAFNFPPLSGDDTQAILTMDVRFTNGKNVNIYFGLAHGEKGVLSNAGAGPQFGICDAAYVIRSAGLGSNTTGAADPSDSGHWIRLKLVMDFTANSGRGSASLHKQDLTMEDNGFTPVTGLQDVKLNLTSAPSTWDAMFIRVQDDSGGAAIDNLSIIPGKNKTTPAPKQALLHRNRIHHTTEIRRIVSEEDRFFSLPYREELYRESFNQNRRDILGSLDAAGRIGPRRHDLLGFQCIRGR